MSKPSLAQLLMEKFLRDRESGKLTWKTGDGEIISIKDLSDEHLKNIIKKETRGYATDIPLLQNEFLND